VDWASFGHVTIGTARRALSAFVLTLTYSRWIFLRFFLDQSLQNFLRGRVYAFADLHGSSRHLLYDNLRAAVAQRHGNAVASILGCACVLPRCAEESSSLTVSGSP
jgi:transposase